MSSVEELRVLAALDFTPGCECDDCPVPAAWTLRTKCCNQVAVLCVAHVERARGNFAAMRLLGGIVCCATCDAEHVWFDGGIDQIQI